METIRKKHLQPLTKHFLHSLLFNKTMRTLEIILASSVSIVLSIIGFIPLYLDFIIRQKEKRTPKIELELSEMSQMCPVENKRCIHISTDKLIKNCSITCGNKLLPCGKNNDKLLYHTDVNWSGAFFAIPSDIENSIQQDTIVTVKSGQKIKKKIEYANIQFSGC